MADRLAFYSKSRDARPGNGAFEFVRDPSAYSELATIVDWRKVLSNFHVSEFGHDGKRYRTIEHAFQAAKIALVSPEKAVLFALESGSAIANGDGQLARANRKLAWLSGEVLCRWDNRSRDVMAEIARSKYAECGLARRVLKATGGAQLWHILPRSKTYERFSHLEALRELIRSGPTVMVQTLRSGVGAEQSPEPDVLRDQVPEMGEASSVPSCVKK